MASHSGTVTVEVAPADSAVSVVGTGVELGARPDAMIAVFPGLRRVVVFRGARRSFAGAVAS